MRLEDFVVGEWTTHWEDGSRFFKPKNREEYLKKLFYHWISQHPESFHPLDIKRFYHFTKAFISYKRKDKNSSWLRKQIDVYGKHSLSDQQISEYCRIFDHLIDFHYFRG